MAWASLQRKIVSHMGNGRWGSEVVSGKEEIVLPFVMTTGTFHRKLGEPNVKQHLNLNKSSRLSNAFAMIQLTWEHFPTIAGHFRTNESEAQHCQNILIEAVDQKPFY